MLRELAPFAGGGGGLLATHQLLGWKAVAAVEIDAYRRDELKARQADGTLPDFPIYHDIRTFDPMPWRGQVDIVTGGFPCQPFSVAGKQLGGADPRNLWPETDRVLREVGPRLALLENVPGLLRHRYFGRVLGDLAESGFRWVWDCFPAGAFGATHLRDRLFILAFQSLEDVAELHSEIASQLWIEVGSDSNAERHQGPISERSEALPSSQEKGIPLPKSHHPWTSEPGVGRVADGVANWMDRVAALGDGQVPIVVAAAAVLLARAALQQ